MFTCKDKCIMVGYSMFVYVGFTIFAMLDIIYVELICSNSIICSNIIYIGTCWKYASLTTPCYMRSRFHVVTHLPTEKKIFCKYLN